MAASTRADAMEPIPHNSERSVARSRNRLRILLLLASLGEAYIGQLARMTGISHARVKACLLGKEPDYRTSLSLVALGLAEERSGPTGRFFVITTRGRRKARSIASQRRRRGAGG